MVDEELKTALLRLAEGQASSAHIELVRRALESKRISVDVSGQGSAAVGDSAIAIGAGGAYVNGEVRTLNVVAGDYHLTINITNDNAGMVKEALADTVNLGRVRSRETRERAEALLLKGAFREAAALLSKLIAEQPADARSKALYCIALLEGRHADLLTDARIKVIEAHALAARTVPEATFLATIVLAIVKHDYYLANGKHEGQPSLNTILVSLRKMEPTRRDLAILDQIQASADIRKFLQNRGWQ